MSMPPNPEDEGEAGDSRLIEGGYVLPLSDVAFEPEQHRAQSSRILAIVLLLLLGGTVVGHYATSAFLRVLGHGDVADSMGRVFDVWLPVISGLSGSAVTYFFTKENS